MQKPIPPWKVWYPLATWKALLIFVAVQLTTVFAGVALREGLGLGIPDWLGPTLGSGLAPMVVLLLARRAAGRRSDAAERRA